MKSLTQRCSAIALAVALSAGGAYAQTQSQEQAGNVLLEYGYDVDASTLTRSQAAALGSIDPDRSQAEITATIDSILDNDVERFPDAPQLRAQADAIFTEYDIPGDSSLLSLNQLVALQSIEDDPMGSDEMTQAAIYSIIGYAPDAAQIGVMEQNQLEALAQTKLDEYDIDADATTLDRNQLTAVLAVDESSMETDNEVVAALQSAVN